MAGVKGHQPVSLNNDGGSDIDNEKGDENLCIREPIHWALLLRGVGVGVSAEHRSLRAEPTTRWAGRWSR